MGSMTDGTGGNGSRSAIDTRIPTCAHAHLMASRIQATWRGFVHRRCYSRLVRATEVVRCTVSVGITASASDGSDNVQCMIVAPYPVVVIDTFGCCMFALCLITAVALLTTLLGMGVKSGLVALRQRALRAQKTPAQDAQRLQHMPWVSSLCRY
eukprot:COSAG02_NODE_2647_length_8336_cov_10.959087_1_plen_154_part_00